MHDSFEKGIKLSSPFALGAQSALDAREVVDDLTQRDALVTGNIAYEGLICYVKSEKKHYKLVDLVNATWEVLGSGTGGDLSDYQKKTDDTLTTTDQTVVGGINELDAEIGDITQLGTNDKTDIVTSINEVNTNLGDISTLKTSNQSSTVEAINELYDDKVNSDDIVDDLVSTNTDKPLSANQGKVLKDELGDLTNLTTTSQTNLVSAINELDSDIGDKSTLTTTDTTDLVSAVNELDSDIGDLTTLTTSKQDSLTNAINEHDSEIGNLTNLQTSVQTSLVDSINEIDDNIGDLTQLKTNVQSSLTESVNEVVDNIGEKREFTPAHYELDNVSGTFTVVDDTKDPFDPDTEVKLTDANKNNDGIPFVTGNRVNFIDEVTTKPASGMYQYIDNAVAQAKDVDLSGYQEKTSDDLSTTDKTLVGAINELVDMLVVPPEYEEPTLKITTNPATLKQEVGTTITPVLSYTFTQNDAGAELSHSYSPLDNAIQAQLTIVEGDNIEYSVTVNYDEGVQKNDNFGKPNGTPIQAGSLTAKVKYVGIRHMFYGVNTVANTYTDSTEVRALTAKEIGSTKITVPVGSKQIVIAVPSTKTISSILYQEQGNANYLGNFTKTTVQVSGATAGADLINYDVYTYNLAIANASIMTFNATIA